MCKLRISDLKTVQSSTTKQHIPVGSKSYILQHNNNKDKRAINNNKIVSGEKTIITRSNYEVE